MEEIQSNITSDELNSMKAQIRKQNKPKIIGSMFQLFVGIILASGVQWIALGFNLDAWKDPQFWAKTLLLTIVIFVIYRSTIGMMITRLESRQKVLDAKKEYNERASSKELDLKEFIDFYNLNSKTVAYVGKINAKILKLENKARRCGRNKKLAKLNKKIEELESLITAEYINEHIKEIRIKYYQIYYTDFSVDNSEASGKGLVTRANYNKALNKASINKMGIYFLSCLALSISVFNFNEFNVAEFFGNLFASSFLIITRVVSAIMDAEGLYDKTVLAAMLGKIEILKQYENWKKDHPSKTQLEVEKERMESKLRDELKIEYEGKMKAQLESYKEELLKQVNSNIDK